MNIKNFMIKVEKFYFSKNLIRIIFAVGIFLRLRQYASNRSLWIDEAALAVNFVARSFSELLLPLSYGQAAPLGFVILEKCAVQVFGPSEYALRFFPLLVSILAMFIFYRVALKLLEPGAVALALGLFAVLQPLIYFASEVKQYSFDVFVTVGILWVAVRILENPKMKLGPLFFCGLCGAIAVWFSFPAIFSLTAAVLILGFHAYRTKRVVPFQLIFIFSLWFVSFIGFYLFSKSTLSLSLDGHLKEYWKSAFMPLMPSPEGVKWYARTFLNTFKFPGGFSQNVLAGLVFLAGIASYLSQKKMVGLGLLATPIVLVLLASAFHVYPFSDRLILFIVPLLIILIAEGAIRIKQSLGRYSGFLEIGFLVLLLAGPVLTACSRVIKPITREEIRPVIGYLKKHIQPADTLYVYNGAEKAFDYYSSVDPVAPAHILGVNSRNDVQGYIKDLGQLEGKPRVWVLFSHIWVANKMDERAYILNYLDSVGRRMDEFVIHADGAVGLNAGDAAVYLYDLSGPFN